MTTSQLSEAKRLWAQGKGVTEIAVRIGVPRETLKYHVYGNRADFPPRERGRK